MWPQTYTPVSDNLPLSALVAALPVFVVLVLLGILRKPAWMAALSGLGIAAAVALLVYRMPISLLASSCLYGAAYGILPIGWIVFTALLLYRLTVETGKFEIIKDSIGSLTSDQRLQALLIAFAFGAFIEGAAGFGTPVAVAAAMLAGLGFRPFFAASLCLLANTSPVAFGSIGTPLVMLATVTGLPLGPLSANVGRICAPVSLFVPAYLVLVMGGFGALRAVAPAAAVCGIAFASAQFLVSSYLGPHLTDILGSHRRDGIAGRCCCNSGNLREPTQAKAHGRSTGEILLAWSPYALLVMFVLMWGLDALPVKAFVNRATITFPWPGLAQPGDADAAGDREAISLRRDVRVQLAGRIRNLVPVRSVRIGNGAARFAKKTGHNDRGNGAAIIAADGDDIERPRARVSNELFR